MTKINDCFGNKIYMTSSIPEKKGEIKEKSPVDPVSTAFKDLQISIGAGKFVDYLQEIYTTENPQISVDIDMVHVLSGRTTALRRDADKLPREFDPQDDIRRMRKGIEIARTVSALRLKKSLSELTQEDCVIPIFYNGRPIHNEDLRAALAQGVFKGKHAYPSYLFIVREIDPQNTIGQIRGLRRLLEKAEFVKNIAMVTSGYHEIRALLSLGSDSPQAHDKDGYPNILADKRFFMFGIDKTFCRKGILFDLKGEREAMEKYSSGDTPSIAPSRCRNTFFNNQQIRLEQSYNLQLQQLTPKPYIPLSVEEQLESADPHSIVLYEDNGGTSVTLTK